MLKGELEKLLKVPTTVKQAKQILKRNQALWKILEEAVPNLLKGFAPKGWKRRDLVNCHGDKTRGL